MQQTFNIVYKLLITKIKIKNKIKGYHNINIQYYTISYNII
jgi:hypothetical protein